MAESETAQKITKAVKAVDKFIADMRKNSKKVRKALEELKESNKEEK